MSYEAIAAGYNRLYGEEQLKKAGLIRNCVRVKKTDLLLDVGCGTGIGSSLFSCNKIGIDPSPKLLLRAAMPAVKGRAEKLPFGCMFDIVISVTAIHNFRNPEKGILEMKRVLKRNGTAAITVLKKSAKHHNICALIRKHFIVKKEVDEGKDTIYFCKRA